MDQKSEWHLDTEKFKQSKHQIEKHRNEERKALLSELKARMSDDCVRAIEISSMKGVSAWLTTLPLQSEKFALNKREFFIQSNSGSVGLSNMSHPCALAERIIQLTMPCHVQRRIHACTT